MELESFEERSRHMSFELETNTLNDTQGWRRNLVAFEVRVILSFLLSGLWSNTGNGIVSGSHSDQGSNPSSVLAFGINN